MSASPSIQSAQSSASQPHESVNENQQSSAPAGNHRTSDSESGYEATTDSGSQSNSRKMLRGIPGAGRKQANLQKQARARTAKGAPATPHPHDDNAHNLPATQTKEGHSTTTTEAQAQAQADQMSGFIQQQMAHQEFMMAQQQQLTAGNQVMSFVTEQIKARESQTMTLINSIQTGTEEQSKIVKKGNDIAAGAL